MWWRLPSVDIESVSLDSEGDDLRSVRAFLDSQETPGVTPFHRPIWNEIVQEVFETSFVYLVALRGSKVVGAMPCHVVKLGDWSRCCYSPPRIFEVPYGGPLVSSGAPGGIQTALVRAAARLGHGSVVDVFCGPDSSDWAWESGLHVRRFETGYADLTRGIDWVWSHSVDSKRRNMIRKAQRSDVSVRLAGHAGLDDYYELCETMAGRTHINPLPKAYYEGVLRGLGSNAQLLLATRHGTTLAGGIFLKDGCTAYYWHGASAGDAGNHGQGELLQWRAIEWASAHGCAQYDLVGIERERLPNIAKFKLGFTDKEAGFAHVSYAPMTVRARRKVGTMVRGDGG